MSKDIIKPYENTNKKKIDTKQLSTASSKSLRNIQKDRNPIGFKTEIFLTTKYRSSCRIP